MQINKYLDKLLEFRSAAVTLADIGVITPYRKQAEKIRKLLEAKGTQYLKFIFPADI